MIEVPGTPEGMPAIQTLIREGINVNVTLLFAREMYERTAEAYLKDWSNARMTVMTSVASRVLPAFYLPYRLRRRQSVGGRRGGQRVTRQDGYRQCEARLRTLILMASDRWQALARDGAQPRRLLWASTSTKNPDYRDVLYVETLLGPTLSTRYADAGCVRDHGDAATTLGGDVSDAEATLAQVAAAGVSLDAITDELLDDGIRLFADAFRELLGVVDGARMAHS